MIHPVKFRDTTGPFPPTNLDKMRAFLPCVTITSDEAMRDADVRTAAMQRLVEDMARREVPGEIGSCVRMGDGRIAYWERRVRESRSRIRRTK